MPRMKVDISDRDLQELEEAEYEEGGQYESYDGEQPPVGTELAGFIKKMWWTYSSNDDDMLKILFVADGNEGTDEEEFDGCPIWENYSLISTMKFKWAPFLDALGLTIRDVIKKTHVEEEEEGNNGQPIIKIGTWVPGSDESYCRVITDHHKYNGEWQTDVGTWLPYEDEEPEPEPEPARPSRRSPRSRSSADSAGTASRSGRRTRTADPEEPQDDEAAQGGGPHDDEGSEEDEQGGRRTGGRARAGRPSRAPGGARAAKPAAARRGRGRASAATDGNEPPF